MRGNESTDSRSGLGVVFVAVRKNGFRSVNGPSRRLSIAAAKAIIKCRYGVTRFGEKQIVGRALQGSTKTNKSVQRRARYGSFDPADELRRKPSFLGKLALRKPCATPLVLQLLREGLIGITRHRGG